MSIMVNRIFFWLPFAQLIVDLLHSIIFGEPNPAEPSYFKTLLTQK